MRRAFVAAAAATLSLFMAACSDDAKSYSDLTELSNAADEAGVACSTIEEQGEAELVQASATCAGGEVRLYLFDDEQALSDWQKVAAGVSPVAVGPNWSVTGDRAAVDKVVEELHAELVTGP